MPTDAMKSAEESESPMNFEASYWTIGDEKSLGRLQKHVGAGIKRIMHLEQLRYVRNGSFDD